MTELASRTHQDHDHSHADSICLVESDAGVKDKVVVLRKEDVVDDGVSHVSSIQTRHKGDLHLLIQFWTLERDEELESFKMSFISLPFTLYCLMTSKYLSDFHYPIILSSPFMHNKRWI